MQVTMRHYFFVKARFTLFFVQAEGVWQVAFYCSSCFVGFVLHMEFNRSTILKLLILKIFFSIRLAIHLNGIYIPV